MFWIFTCHDNKENADRLRVVTTGLALNWKYVTSFVAVIVDGIVQVVISVLLYILISHQIFWNIDKSKVTNAGFEYIQR